MNFRIHKLVRWCTGWIWQPPRIASWCMSCKKWYSPYVRVVISVRRGDSLVSRMREYPPDIVRKDDGETCMKCQYTRSEWAMRQNIRANDEWRKRFVGSTLDVTTVERTP